MSKLPQDIVMIPCNSCGEPMPELRITLYGISSALIVAQLNQKKH